MIKSSITNNARLRLVMATVGMVLGSVTLLTAAARPGYSAPSASVTKEVAFGCPTECESATGWSCIIVSGSQYLWYSDCKPKTSGGSLEGGCVIGVPPESELIPVKQTEAPLPEPDGVPERTDATGGVRTKPVK